MLDPVHMDVLVRQRQSRYLHEVEQDRLVRLARAARRKCGRSNVRALAWLGQRLIAWGQNLQRHGGLELNARSFEQCQPC